MDCPRFWRVTLPFLAGYFVSYVYRSVNAIIGPELAREFGLSAAGLGLLSGIYFFAFALFQLPLGVLLDRYGPRRVNAHAAADRRRRRALVRVRADRPLELTLARAVMGLGVSAGLMAALSAFALWYPADRLATLNGVAFACGMLGAIAVTVPLEYLLRSVGWREVFHGIVALNVAVCLALYFAVPETRGRAARRSARAAAAGVRRARARPGVLAHGAVHRHQPVRRGVVEHAVGRHLAARRRRLHAGGGRARAARVRGVDDRRLPRLRPHRRRVSRRAGRSSLPLLAGGVAVGSFCLALLALGVRTGALALWTVFFTASSAVVLSYALFARRYPKEMSGRVNTALNVFVFTGMFTGQWAVGAVLNLWPPTAAGYAPEGYPWALGLLWAAQFGGLAWLWSGRRLSADVALHFTSNSPTITTSPWPLSRSVTTFSASCGVPKRVASFSCSVVAPATICCRLP